MSKYNIDNGKTAVVAVRCSSSEFWLRCWHLADLYYWADRLACRNEKLSGAACSVVYVASPYASL